jgi:hypothetical protein
MPRFEYPSLRQGLVGCWVPSLGASGLSLIDRSGRNNHGTLTNMGGQDNWKASGSGVALTSDGVDDWVSVARSIMPSGGQPKTFCGWIYKESFSNYGIILDAGSIASMARVLFMVIGAGGYSGFTNGQVVVEYYGGTSGTTVNTYTLRTWTHLAATMGSAQQDTQIYMNGVAVTTRHGIGPSTVINTSSAALTGIIGTGGRGVDSAYGAGSYDDIRIYNRALTPAEIRLLASRRGIGLSPLPDRGGGLPRKLSVNVGGTWRAGDAYVNTGSGWRLGIPYVNVGGTFR